jgi:sugar lactone lactonase YvrE
MARQRPRILTWIFCVIMLFSALSEKARPNDEMAPGAIVTVAGTGLAGVFSKGGMATQSNMTDPGALAVDRAGRLIIADSASHSLARVDANGFLTAIAGTGSAGFAGDGGLAAGAMFNTPSYVAVGPDDSIYVCDSANYRIRKIAPSGLVQTVVGNGKSGFSGDGGPATLASIAFSVGIALDRDGNLYVADAENHRIRKVDTNGVITTSAGNGNPGYSGDGAPALSASLDHPRDVCLAPDGSLYIADGFNHRVRKVDPNGAIHTVAGTGTAGFGGDGGPAIEAKLNHPVFVTLDAQGNLYITDALNHCIRMVDKQGIIWTVAGEGRVPGFYGDGGMASEALLNVPQNTAVFGDRMYIADTGNRRVRMVKLPVPLPKPLPLGWQHTPSPGTIETVVGNGIPGAFGAGLRGPEVSLSRPHGIGTDDEGNLYIADHGNHRILLVGTKGMVSTICGLGRPGYSGDGGPATKAALKGPADVRRDAQGNIYIADHDNHRVRKIDTAGIIHTLAGTGEAGFSGDGGPAVSARLDHPVAVTADAQGYVYIADKYNHRVRRADKDGRIATVAGTGVPGYSGDGVPAQYADLIFPRAVALDRQGNLYVADEDGHRLRKIDANGIITTAAGTGRAEFSGDGGRALSAGLRCPRAVVADDAGNIYLADSMNHCIRRIAADGTISTIAGIGAVPGFLGDGGRADRALLNQPSALTLHGNYLYIADTENHRVRRVTLNLPTAPAR